jgi:hypothetical protein
MDLKALERILLHPAALSYGQNLQTVLFHLSQHQGPFMYPVHWATPGSQTILYQTMKFPAFGLLFQQVVPALDFGLYPGKKFQNSSWTLRIKVVRSFNPPGIVYFL